MFETLTLQKAGFCVTHGPGGSVWKESGPNVLSVVSDQFAASSYEVDQGSTARFKRKAVNLNPQEGEVKKRDR